MTILNDVVEALQKAQVPPSAIKLTPVAKLELYKECWPQTQHLVKDPKTHVTRFMGIPIYSDSRLKATFYLVP